MYGLNHTRCPQRSRRRMIQSELTSFKRDMRSPSSFTYTSLSPMPICAFRTCRIRTVAAPSRHIISIHVLPKRKSHDDASVRTPAGMETTHLIPAGETRVSGALVCCEECCKQEASCCIDCNSGRIGASSAILHILQEQLSLRGWCQEMLQDDASISGGVGCAHRKKLCAGDDGCNEA